MKRIQIKVAFVSIWISILSIYCGCSNIFERPIVGPRQLLTDKAFIAQYIYARPSLNYDIEGITSLSADKGFGGVRPNSLFYTVVRYRLVFRFNLCGNCNPHSFLDAFTPSGELKRKEYVVSFDNRIAEFDALRKYHKDTTNKLGISQFVGIAVADTLEYIHITSDRKYSESHTASPYYMDDIVNVSLESAGIALREYHTTGIAGVWNWYSDLRVSYFNMGDSIPLNLLDTKMSFSLEAPPYSVDTFQLTFHWRYKNGTEYRTTLPRLIITR
ncbi:MAG: hypothetical protein QM536_01695 [Chitinophagaceae bacterium]|nr:hypothetical protein [Chitinophagaceae bacterium]